MPREDFSELRSRLDTLESLLNNLPGMVFRCLTDMDLTFSIVSEGSRDILGSDPGELENIADFRSMVHADDQEQNRRVLASVSKDNPRYTLVYRIGDAEGNLHWVKEQGKAVFDRDGQWVAIDGVLTDITEQKRIEAELRHENRMLKSGLGERYRFGELIGKSPAMQRIYELMIKAGASRAPVVITGESGTGKELTARGIHNLSSRKDGPFVAVNCAAIPDNLLESEFFGYKKGAFTGAERDHRGYLDEAHGGTLFLDEAADISPAMQAKLLRVLEDSSFIPLGGNFAKTSDFRLIAATNTPLAELMEKKAMRQDFYYRISTIPIQLPPLRERKEDLGILVDYFLRTINPAKSGMELPQEARLAILNYHWPGNVRELRNLLHRFLTLGEFDFASVAAQPQAAPQTAPDEPEIEPGQDLQSAMDGFERRFLLDALNRNRWHITNTAQSIGVSRRTLQRRIKHFALK